MDYDGWLRGSNQIEDRATIADIYMMMCVVRDRSVKLSQNPRRISLGSEKHCALVIVNADDAKPLPGKKAADFRSNETARACDKGRLPKPAGTFSGHRVPCKMR
jgi:hypothetical protein